MTQACILYEVRQSELSTGLFFHVDSRLYFGAKNNKHLKKIRCCLPSLIVHADYILRASACTHTEQLFAFVAVDYHTVRSPEMIF